MQPIKIDGINQDPTQYGQKVTITSGKDKFSFFDTKKDGTFTKAWEQYKKYRYAVGDTVHAEVKDNPYTDKKGVARVGKNIIYFEEVEGVPTHTTAPRAATNTAAPVSQNAAMLQALQAEMVGVKARLSNIVNLNNLKEKVVSSPIDDIPPFENIDDEIKPEDLPF